MPRKTTGTKTQVQAQQPSVSPEELLRATISAHTRELEKSARTLATLLDTAGNRDVRPSEEDLATLDFLLNDSDVLRIIRYWIFRNSL